MHTFEKHCVDVDLDADTDADRRQCQLLGDNISSPGT